MWKIQPTDNLSMAYLDEPQFALGPYIAQMSFCPEPNLLRRGGEGPLSVGRESNAADGHSSLKSKASAHAGNKVLGNASHQATTS